MKWVVVLALSVPAAALAACDPKLDIAVTPGSDGGAAQDGGGSTCGGPGPAQDDGGVDEGGVDEAGSTEGGTDDGGTGHVIDGTNHFLPGETFTTTSAGTGYQAYVTWSSTALYFGMQGPDISATTANPGSKWVMVYLGSPGVPGATTGLPYNGVQQPTLPFASSYNLRWKVDGSYPNVQKWNDTTKAWVDAGFGVPLTVKRSGDFVEMSVGVAAIGSPTKLDVHMNMLIEGNNADWTYSGAPSTSFVDGKNPMFTKYFEFDLTNTTTAPNTYPIKP